MTTLSHTLRLAAASLLLLTACAGARQTTPMPDNSSAGLWQQIQAANSNLACDSDSQCHTIGTGAKACGGPENYIAWSSKNDNGAKLKSLVELHSAARRADNNSQGMMSTCIAISDPGATCRAGTCVLNTQDVAPPPAK
ncbi:hypothetical protein FHW58_005357 [Duganella sp. 1224]|uniref:hypothetical protein n=1 Tax=Duganella sp. 1224 TaxID=2587052 RepID=UPI0015CC06C7|nr:hypothetical protein [Duganella sp. 1224]NYE64122.1 hypothetical protein [Duganella sp. 1224]